MKTALFISGRLTCYEEDFIKVLNTTFYYNDIDLFISINGIRDEYHIEAEERLYKWLRKIDYEEYNLPESFINKHPETLTNNINGKIIPYTVMSMFYNDKKNFKNIEGCSKENNITYDIVCKFRSDISFINPFIEISFKRFTHRDNTLFSCIPPSPVILYSHIKAGGPLCISDAFAFGSMDVMKRYCSTYDSIFIMNKKCDGYFRLNYETTLSVCFWGKESFSEYTEDMIDRLYNAVAKCPFKIEHFNLLYNINNKRRERDIVKNLSANI